MFKFILPLVLALITYYFLATFAFIQTHAILLSIIVFISCMD
ncbi:MAG: hypothetical protein R2837_03595 [Aliarcobacter sp.]